jgi:hypothetical protein
VYQRDFTDKQLEDTPTTPGMKYRHYSPHAPLLLLDPTTAWQQQQQQQQQRGAQNQQQQSHWGGLEQAMTQATQQLLHNLWQQQQGTQMGQPEAVAARQRVVLLSTCNGSSSNGGEQDSRVGWTAASLQDLSNHLQQQPQPQPGSSLLPADGSSSGSSGVEVLEYVLGSWQQPELVAHQLFAALRTADTVAPDLIIAQGLPPQGPALAVMNRLHKAASTHVQVQQT